MQREFDFMNKALSSSKTPLNHQYKTVCCGVGKVAAGAEASLELSTRPYDLVVVVGYAAASPYYNQSDLVIPSSCRYHDVHVPPKCVSFDLPYELEGNDDCIAFTGDSFVDADVCSEIRSRFNVKNCLYDMEITAVAQVASEFKTPVLALKFVSDVPETGHSLQSFEEFVNTHTDFSQFVSYLELLPNFV